MITDLRSFLKVSCHTKFRFAEREAQCILDECGPLRLPNVCDSYNFAIYTMINSIHGRQHYRAENIEKKVYEKEIQVSYLNSLPWTPQKSAG